MAEKFVKGTFQMSGIENLSRPKQNTVTHLLGLRYKNGMNSVQLKIYRWRRLMLVFKEVEALALLV